MTILIFKNTRTEHALPQTNKNNTLNTSDYFTSVLRLPLGADEAPKLVAYINARARGGVDVDGGCQVCTIVHCNVRKEADGLKPHQHQTSSREKMVH